MLKNFLKINLVNLIMILTLALTWPDFHEGLVKGLIIALKVNVIYFILAKFHDRLYRLILNPKVPEKFRILIILTLRGIFILKERYDAALISLKVRAPDLQGILKFKTFSYILGSILLQSSRHSENIFKSIISRGGFNGFNQANEA